MPERQYPLLKAGTLDHEGTSYEQARTDVEFVMIVELGDLLLVNELIEVWRWQGKVTILPNEIGILE